MTEDAHSYYQNNHPGKVETVAKVAAEAIGIPAAGRDGLDPSGNSSAYHQHPPNAYHTVGPVHDLGAPGTKVKGGIVSGKFEQGVGLLTGDKEERAEGLDDEALGLNRSGKQSHNVEEMRATRDKALAKHHRAQELRGAMS
ncbi:hypothetical protein SCHPADRAFT_895017 [Schizopora paradoxa]|uniref:Uncharacterized protein n=1 Tax=Schizopora paradoxa TaxID=27342 RepID=A0A0H2RBZ6_9AGAM|nr:hypothetical protein SCHPADRAFT_895017 [Schizopora paradoxa]